MNFKDFTKSKDACAESFDKWVKESGFDPIFICPTVLDFYLAWELSQDKSESEVLDIISKLYRVNLLILKNDTVAGNDEDKEDTQMFSEKNLDKFSKILEKMIELEKMRSEKK